MVESLAPSYQSLPLVAFRPFCGCHRSWTYFLAFTSIELCGVDIVVVSTANSEFSFFECFGSKDCDGGAFWWQFKAGYIWHRRLLSLSSTALEFWTGYKAQVQFFFQHRMVLNIILVFLLWSLMWLLRWRRWFRSSIIWSNLKNCINEACFNAFLGIFVFLRDYLLTNIKDFSYVLTRAYHVVLAAYGRICDKWQLSAICAKFSVSSDLQEHLTTSGVFGSFIERW